MHGCQHTTDADPRVVDETEKSTVTLVQAVNELLNLPDLFEIEGLVYEPFFPRSSEFRDFRCLSARHSDHDKAAVE